MEAIASYIIVNGCRVLNSIKIQEHGAAVFYATVPAAQLKQLVADLQTILSFEAPAPAPCNTDKVADAVYRLFSNATHPTDVFTDNRILDWASVSTTVRSLSETDIHQDYYTHLTQDEYALMVRICNHLLDAHLTPHSDGAWATEAQ